MAHPDAHDAPAVRDLLAKRIIEAAMENGERDPERLKAYALDGFTPHQTAQRLPHPFGAFAT